MALWRCPHCGTPQPVAARCWVCRRSSTSCGTCRHFRSSVAARIGYCGLDRDRLPLAGDEIRACWVGRPLLVEDEPPVAADEPTVAPPLSTEPYLSGFVPVGPPPVIPPRPVQRAPVEPPPPPVAGPAPAPDGVLWTELEA
jgi:hypothetical protein